MKAVRFSIESRMKAVSFSVIPRYRLGQEPLECLAISMKAKQLFLIDAFPDGPQYFRRPIRFLDEMRHP